MPNRLKEIRITEEITQQELADELGIGQPRISQIERHQMTLSFAEAHALLEGVNRIVAARDPGRTYSLTDLFPGFSFPDRFQPAGVASSDKPLRWDEVWGERALQDLGQWLVRHDVAPDVASLAVERVWLFYSYFALPVVRRRVPMGIAGVARSTQVPEICFYLPFRLDADRLDASRLAEIEEPDALRAAFRQEIASPLDSRLSVALKLVSAHLDRVERLEPRLRRYCDRLGLEFVGIFRDDLTKELMTVLGSKRVETWLRTPNSTFGWARPSESLDDPLDYRLRDMVVRAKFGLPAA